MGNKKAMDLQRAFLGAAIIIIVALVIMVAWIYAIQGGLSDAAGGVAQSIGGSLD